MEQNVECSNPSNLLCGLLDTFSCAAYILDDEKNFSPYKYCCYNP